MIRANRQRVHVRRAKLVIEPIALNEKKHGSYWMGLVLCHEYEPRLGKIKLRNRFKKLLRLRQQAMFCFAQLRVQGKKDIQPLGVVEFAISDAGLFGLFDVCSLLGMTARLSLCHARRKLQRVMNAVGVLLCEDGKVVPGPYPPRNIASQ